MYGTVLGGSVGVVWEDGGGVVGGGGEGWGWGMGWDESEVCRMCVKGFPLYFQMGQTRPFFPDAFSFLENSQKHPTTPALTLIIPYIDHTMNHCPPSSSRWPHDIVSCLANDLSQNNENVDNLLASVDAILEEVESDDDDTDRSPQPSSDAETDEDVDVDTLLTDLSTIYDEMMTQPTHTVSTPPRPPQLSLSFVRRPPFAPLTPFYYHPHPQSLSGIVSGIAGTLTPLNIPITANTPCWVLHQMGHDTYLATTRKGAGGVQWMVHASEMVSVEDCRRVTEEDGMNTEEDGMNDVLRMVDDVLLKEQEQEPQQPQETVSPIYVYV